MGTKCINANSCKCIKASASFSEVSFFSSVASVAAVYSTEGEKELELLECCYLLKNFQQKKSTTASDQLPKTQILDFMDTIK